MAKGVNKVIILGNLGRDPETRYTQSGTPVTQFSVATSEHWKDKQTGDNRDRTEWHNIACFGRLAEVAGEYLKKGSKVYVEGQLRTTSWEKDGRTNYRTEIIARDLQMLGGGGQQRQEPAQQPTREAVAQATFDDEDFEDDIPF